jgi:hypothetical protein
MTLDPEMQKKVGAFLPRTLELVIESYERYMRDGKDSDDKSFTAKHTAGKAAVAHITLLLKLSADLLKTGALSQDDHARLLAACVNHQQAMADVAEFLQQAGDDDEGDV